MKCFTAIAALAVAANTVSAHYIAQYLSVGGTKYAQYQHIRKNTNNNSPVTSLSDTNLRCNVGGASGKATTTIDIAAGSAFTFTYDQAVYHQGPISFYMSKAPGAVADYDGSGSWFKFKDIGPSFSGSTASWQLSTSYTANIPKCIPNGEYLLRIQSLAIHNPGSTPQFYVSCAQVRVTGGGSSNPGVTTNIPGFIKASDPGYTANIYDPSFKSYTVPGPAVWNC